MRRQRDELVATGVAKKSPVLGGLDVVDTAVREVGPVQEEIGTPLRKLLDPPRVAPLSLGKVEKPVAPH